MTTLNFKEMLQAEINKVQDYVDSKKADITNTELTLFKDKSRLAELEFELKVLTDKKNEFQSFEEWQSSNVKPVKTKTASKEDTATAKEFAKVIINDLKKNAKVEDADLKEESKE